MKLRKQGKTWKLKSMLPSTAITTTSNPLNQNNNYKLPSETDKYIEELELHKQLDNQKGPEPIMIRDAGRTQIAWGSKTVLAFFAPTDKELIKQHYPFVSKLKPL